MIGVILAAGRGSRMGGLTADRPKAMLPVAGKPIIARVVEQLAAADIFRIIIVVALDDAHVRPYFAAHPPENISLTFAVQPYAGGMAHALMQAAPHIDAPFAVTACDSLYPDGFYAALASAHRAQSAPATLSVMELPPEVIPRASSVEIFGGRVVRIVEKPALADAPSHIGSLALYAFNPVLLDYLAGVAVSARGEMELQDAIQQLMTDAGGLAFVQTPWRWELTIPADLLDVNVWWLSRNPALHDSAVAGVPPLVVDAEAAIAADVSLGPAVYVEAGARIGAGAAVRQSVVLRGGVVSAGETVENRLISAISTKD